LRLRLNYENLFPLPPGVQSGETAFNACIDFGTLGEFKAKHPELFGWRRIFQSAKTSKDADKPDSTDTSVSPDPANPATE